MKSEPDVFSFDDLKKKGTAGWDGVRNYQARNFMREMRVGDKVLFYHSNAAPAGIAGLAEVARTAYPDPTADAPGWIQVDVRFVERLPRFLSLDELRGVPALAQMRLFRQSRLSVQPVDAAHWKAILALAKAKRIP
jgi:predicted RNA-binding protein with PUA-like domain